MGVLYVNYTQPRVFSVESWAALQTFAEYAATALDKARVMDQLRKARDTGIVNIATGWGEMIKCPAEINRDRGRLLGATWGPLKGVAMTAIRTAVGVLEVGLFFYPLPGDYDPMLQPEFIWPGDIFIADLHGSTAPINP